MAEIYPDLVVKGADGLVQTVQYQKLTPMLLNELQKQNLQGRQQRELIQQQSDEIQRLEARLAALERLVSSATTKRTPGTTVSEGLKAANVPQLLSH